MSTDTEVEAEAVESEVGMFATGCSPKEYLEITLPDGALVTVRLERREGKGVWGWRWYVGAPRTVRVRRRKFEPAPLAGRMAARRAG
jgi:hypothetical protein